MATSDDETNLDSMFTGFDAKSIPVSTEMAAQVIDLSAHTNILIRFFRERKSGEILDWRRYYSPGTPLSTKKLRTGNDSQSGRQPIDMQEQFSCMGRSKEAGKGVRRGRGSLVSSQNVPQVTVTLANRRLPT